MFTLTKAMPGDEALCMEIIADGRQFQQEQGFVQWTEAYPALPDIAEDIKTHRAYLLREDGEVLGYLCLDFDGEPAYDAITDKGLRNSRMQHILEKNGFTRRGIIVFKGSQKYAYDKRI